MIVGAREMKRQYTLLCLLALFAHSACAQVEFGDLQWDDTQVASSIIPHSWVASGYMRGSSSSQQFILVRNMTIKFDQHGQTGSRQFPLSAYRLSPKPASFVTLTNESLSSLRPRLAKLSVECRYLSPETYLKYLAQELPETDDAQREWQNLPTKQQADNWCALGHLYLERGKPENALSCFKKSETLAYRNPNWEIDDYRIPWAMREMAFGYARMLKTKQRGRWLALHTDFLANLRSAQDKLVERTLVAQFETIVSPPLSEKQFSSSGVPDEGQVFAGASLKYKQAVTFKLKPNQTGELTVYSVQTHGVLSKDASFEIVGPTTPDFTQHPITKQLKEHYPIVEKSTCWELKPFGWLFYPLPEDSGDSSALFFMANREGSMFLPLTDVRELKKGSSNN